MKKEDEGKERKRKGEGIIYLFIKNDEKEIDIRRALKSLFDNYFLN